MARSPKTAAPVMSATVKRHLLADALATVAAVAAKRNSIPALGCVLLRTGGAELQLACSDMDQRISTSIDCDGTMAGEILVNAHQLRDLVATMDGEQVTLSLVDSRLHLSARNGGLRKLPTLPADDFPLPHVIDPVNQVTADRVALARIIGTVRDAQSDEETRYYLNGMLAERVDERLRLIATDGHQLRFDHADADFDTDDWPENVIIARNTITVLSQLLKSAAEDDSHVDIAVSNAAVSITIGPVSLWSKLIDASYPDYRRIIPGSLPIQFDCPAAEMVRAIKAVEPAATEKTRAVCLDLGTAQSTVSVIDTTGGEAIEPVANAQLRMADSHRIGFNAKYLKGIYQLFGGQPATMECADTSSAVRITSPAHEGLTVILMPMRI